MDLCVVFWFFWFVLFVYFDFCYFSFLKCDDICLVVLGSIYNSIINVIEVWDIMYIS